MRKTTFGRKGALAVSALALAVAAFAAPATAQSPAAPAQTGAGKTVAIITPDYANQPATKESVDSLKADLESRGYTAKVVDTGGDNAAIANEMTTAIAQHVDAIVNAFGDPKQFGEGLAAAATAGTPVFGMDTGGVVPPTLANVTSDNTANGTVTAQAIVDALGGTGNVAMITFDDFLPVALRGQAAKAVFEASGIKVVEYVQGDPANSTDFAKSTTLDWLTKYPAGQLGAVWTGWDASALGAYQATQESNRPEVLVTGVDGQDFAKAEVAKGGNWIMTVRQDWPAIAHTVANLIDAHFAGTDPAESTVYVPGVVVTKDNAQ
jgi:ribose transport system substrate-binding protein